MEHRGVRTGLAVVVGLLSALALACGGDSPTETEPERPVDGSSRLDLYRIHPDGTDEQRILGDDYRLVTELEFSPGRERLAAVGIDDEPFRTHVVTWLQTGRARPT